MQAFHGEGRVKILPAVRRANSQVNNRYICMNTGVI